MDSLLGVPGLFGVLICSIFYFSRKQKKFTESEEMRDLYKARVQYHRDVAHLINSGHEKGLNEGREEGRKEGKQEEKQEILIR